MVGWGDHVQMIDVIFEKFPHFCSHCKLLGHSLDFCYRLSPRRDHLKGKAPQNVHSTDRPGSSGPIPHSRPDFESSGARWIQKQGRPRAGPQTATHVVQPSSNPFEVLQTIQDDACHGGSPAVGVTHVPDISQIPTTGEYQPIPPAPVVQAEEASVVCMGIQSASTFPSNPNVNLEEVSSIRGVVDPAQLVPSRPPSSIVGQSVLTVQSQDSSTALVHHPMPERQRPITRSFKK